MIRVAPNSVSGRILRIVVSYEDDGVDVERIVQSIYESPKFPVLRGTRREREDAYSAWREEVTAARSEWTRRVSRTLGRLQEGGFIETRGAPKVAAWFAERALAKGTRAALESVVRGSALENGEREQDSEVDANAARLGIVDALMSSSPPRSTKDALGSSPSGARTRAWAWLVDTGVVVPPSYRVATPAGVERVRSWGGA